MTALLSLVILVFIAYLSSVLVTKVRFNQTWLKAVYYTGSVYILLGIITGPKFLNILNESIINQLNVLYALVLGWAGFLIGLQTNIKSLSRFRRVYFLYASLNFALAMVMIFGLLFIATTVFFNGNISYTELLIITVASAITSPIMMGVINRDHPVHGRKAHLIQFVPAFDNVLGTIVFGVIMAVVSGLAFFQKVHWTVLMSLFPIMIGGISSLLYINLGKKLNADQENLLLTLGLLLFVVGVAYYLKQSLIFSGFVFGLGISNSKMSTKNLYLNIQKAEKPLYVLLLIFVGANLRYVNQATILLAVFMGIHILSNLISAFLSGSVLSPEERLPRLSGLANLGMGGLSLAIVLDYFLSYESEYAQMLLLVLTISIIVSDIISLHYLERILVRKKA